MEQVLFKNEFTPFNPIIRIKTWCSKPSSTISTKRIVSSSIKIFHGICQGFLLFSLLFSLISETEAHLFKEKSNEQTRGEKMKRKK